MNQTKNNKKPVHTNSGRKFRSSKIGIAKERDDFLENVSLLASSGMAVVTALETLSNEMRSSRMRKLVGFLKAEVDSGSTLWQAMEATGIFSAYTISIVRTGEESGSLPEHLKAVSAHQAKQQLFRSQIRSAMSYPILILVLTLVIGSGIAYFILPKLTVVFAQLNVKLPLATRMIIKLGAFLETQGFRVIPAFIGSVLLLMYIIFLAPYTNRFGQMLLFNTPGVKKLMQEVELSRFGYLLGSMLEGGLSLGQALTSLSVATPFYRYSKFYLQLKSKLEDGYTFQQSFALLTRSRKLLSPSVRQLLVAGEQSGSLHQTLKSIGETYEAKTEVSTKNLTTMLEPMMLIIVWLAVVGLALGVIMPIYSLIGGLQSGR